MPKRITSVPELAREWDGRWETLDRLASEYDGGPTSIRKWLYDIFGYPEKRTWSAPADMVDGQMRYSDVIRIAADWDREGFTTPSEFTYALRYDIIGMPEYQAMHSVLVKLGNSNRGTFFEGR